MHHVMRRYTATDRFGRDRIELLAGSVVTLSESLVGQINADAGGEPILRRAEGGIYHATRPYSATLNSGIPLRLDAGDEVPLDRNDAAGIERDAPGTIERVDGAVVPTADASLPDSHGAMSSADLPG